MPPCCLRRGSERHVVVHAVRQPSAARRSSGPAGRRRGARVGCLWRLKQPTAAPPRARSPRPACTEAAPGRHAHARRHDHLRPAERRRPRTTSSRSSRRATRARSTTSGSRSMYLPLYNNLAYGGSPGVDYGLSVANKPVFSDGDKTVTIHAEAGLQVERRQPVDAKDVLFDVALIKAAVDESAANWGSFTPGYFPRTSRASARPASTRWSCISSAPSTRASSSTTSSRTNVYPLPSQAWNIASAGGPHLNWNDPGERQEDLRLPRQGGRPGRGLRHQPAVEGRRRAVHAEELQPRQQLLDGEARTRTTAARRSRISSTLQGDTYTGITPMLNAMRTGSLDIGSVDFSQLDRGLRRSSPRATACSGCPTSAGSA